MPEHHCLCRALPARLRDFVSQAPAPTAQPPAHLQPPRAALPVRVWEQCVIRGLRSCSRTRMFFTIPFQTFSQTGSALVSVCAPHIPAHALHPVEGPNPSTTARVKYTCRCACAVGTKNWTISCFLALVSRNAPAACLLASPRCARLSTTSCPPRVISPISWEPSGSGLARGTALFFSARRSQIRAHVLAVFCTISNPSSIMVYRVRLQPQRRLVPLLHRGHPSAEQTLHQLVRALHKPFGLGVPTCLARHERFLVSRQLHCSHQRLYCPFIRHLMISRGASASPLSVTAAASVTPDTSSPSASTTSMSSASPRNAQCSQTRGAMISLFFRFFVQSQEKYTSCETEDEPACTVGAQPTVARLACRALAATASVEASSMSPSFSVTTVFLLL